MNQNQQKMSRTEKVTLKGPNQAAKTIYQAKNQPRYIYGDKNQPRIFFPFPQPEVPIGGTPASGRPVAWFSWQRAAYAESPESGQSRENPKMMSESRDDCGKSKVHRRSRNRVW